MAKEKYDKNNYDHNTFYWNQDWLNKANANKSIWELFRDWVISKKTKDKAMKQIQKWEKRIYLWDNKTKSYMDIE